MKKNIQYPSIFFFLMMFSVTSFSLNKVFIGRSFDHQPWLEISSPCDQVLQEIKSIQDSDFFDKRSIINVLKSDSASCRIDLSYLLPEVVAELVATTSRYNGPNCWNTALRTSRLINLSRFTSENEFSFWMKSPYCRQLKNEEQALAGDIVAMRIFDPGENQTRNEYTAKQSVELHAMVYLSPLLAFSKDTSKKDDFFEIKEGLDVYNLYRFDSEQCKKISGIRPKDCFRWANYYRCHSPDQDRALQIQNSETLKTFRHRVDLIEKEISQYSMGHMDLSKERILELRAKINQLLNELARVKYKDKKKAFFREEIVQILKSLDIQAQILIR